MASGLNTPEKALANSDNDFPEYPYTLNNNGYTFPVTRSKCAADSFSMLKLIKTPLRSIIIWGRTGLKWTMHAILPL